jgi:histidinol-phosphate aminotransferase
MIPMTYKLNKRLEEIKNYKASQGDYKIKLDANESFIEPGKELKDRVFKELSSLSFNRYPDNIYEELRSAFGEYYGVNPKLVIAGNGSDEFLTVIIGSFLRSDDVLLLSEPDFSMYRNFASIYERKTVSINRTADGDSDIDAIIDKTKQERIDVIILSNPSAFHSTVMDRKSILRLVDSVSSLVVIDEAYMDFSDQSILDAVEERNNLVVLKTCSKAIGLAGIRLGFSIASEKITNVLNILRPPYNLNVLTEVAGRVIFSDANYIDASIDEIKKSRDYLYSSIKALESYPEISKVYPTATNYICIETGCSNKIYERLKSKSIIVRKQGKMLRITAGTDDENIAVVNAMKSILGGKR